VVSEAEPNQTANGTVQYTYDAMGRKKTVSYPNTLKISSTGSPNWIPTFQTFTQTVSYVYNGMGQLESQTWTHGDSTQKTISYEYDTDGGCSCGGGRLTKQINPNNTEVVFTYNSLGEETSRTVNKVVGGVTTELGAEVVTHDHQGRVNGSSQAGALQYDALGRLVQEEWWIYIDTWRRRRRSYSYDNNGNRTDQSIHKDYPTGEESETIHYTYDKGNRLTQSDTSVWDGDEYVPYSSQTMTYDGNGNGTKPTGSSTTLSYYADNRLKDETPYGSSTQTNVYDGVGRLYSRGPISAYLGEQK
jgi:YD repeat-containing protein